jgi:uncharacterized protein YyaL (SSP411 family)
VTGKEFLRTITEEILDYVVREMLDPEGGFYSIQDADSEAKRASSSSGRPVRSLVCGNEADESTLHRALQHFS